MIRVRSDADLDHCARALRLVHAADRYPLNVPEGDRRTGAVAFYEATGWRFTHTTVADWSSAGRPVRLRHYLSGEWADGTGAL